VCVWVGTRKSYYVVLSVCLYGSITISSSKREREREREWGCVFKCVCASEREREREREKVAAQVGTEMFGVS
jgi:hypothetical protein